MYRKATEFGAEEERRAEERLRKVQEVMQALRNAGLKPLQPAAPSHPVVSARPAASDATKPSRGAVFPFPMPEGPRLDEAIHRLRDFQRGGHGRSKARKRLAAVVGGLPASLEIAGQWAEELEQHRRGSR